MWQGDYFHKAQVEEIVCVHFFFRSFWLYCCVFPPCPTQYISYACGMISPSYSESTIKCQQTKPKLLLADVCSFLNIASTIYVIRSCCFVTTHLTRMFCGLLHQLRMSSMELLSRLSCQVSSLCFVYVCKYFVANFSILVSSRMVLDTELHVVD